MMPPDWARLGWMRQHEDCFPEDILPYAWSLWDEKGVDWLCKLCTIDGELELYEMQRYYEAAARLALVIQQDGFEMAERYCGRDPSDAEREMRKAEEGQSQYERYWEDEDR